MSNLVPKLNILNFLKFHENSNSLDSFITNKMDNFICGILSQSCWSLCLIALWRRKIYNKKKINILIPEYFCNSTLTPLRKMGFDLIFYKLNEDLTPDRIFLENLSRKNEIDIFLAVNYFGIKGDFNFIKDFCKNQKCWLVKDSAHSLNQKEISNEADFIFFSPHKILSFPMGSVLVINSEGPSKFNYNIFPFIRNTKDWHLQISYELNIRKLKTKINYLYSINWFLKRLVQSLNFQINLRNKLNFLDDITQENIAQFLNPKIDLISKFIIKNNKINLFEEVDSRLRLSLVLENLLNSLGSDNYGKISYINNINIKSEQLPYFAMIDTDNALKLYDDLKKNNIDCISWPDQPPEVKKSDLKTSIKLRNRRVFIPLFNIRMYKNLLNFKKYQNEKNFFFQINWNNFDKSTWENNYQLIERNNLLQSWDYGEFKKNFENFKILRGLIFDDQKKLIGMVQILYKTLFGIGVIRLNRGPLLIKKNDYLSKLIIHKIKKDLYKNKRIIFSFEPELNFSSDNIIGIDRKIINKPSWKSSLINLKQELEEIYKNFKKEWRKDLKKSLNANNLKIYQTKNKDKVNFVIDHYKNEANKKGFKPINTKLINFLNSKSNLLTLICENDGDYIGSLCVAKHYPSATCIINPILNEGRELKINHYLIWKAIETLKNNEYSFLDTGGIDFENSPGPASFKMGLNGETYKLIGQKFYI